MKFVLLLTLCAAILASPVVASAETTVTACGVPLSTELNTDPHWDYCNVYTRQLAYQKERQALHEKLIARQKNFAAPSLEAVRGYEKNLAEMHKAVSSKPAAAQKEEGEPDALNAEDAPQTAAEASLPPPGAAQRIE